MTQQLEPDFQNKIIKIKSVVFHFYLTTKYLI